MYLVTRAVSRKRTAVSPTASPCVASLMMMLGLGFLLQRLPSKKVLLLLLLTEVFGAFRVVALHFQALFRGEVWKVANEEDQLPTVFTGSMPPEGGHTREANAIFNDPEDFAVGKILSVRLTQIGRLGIKSTTQHGVATTVISVTDSAVICKMQAGLAKNF